MDPVFAAPPASPESAAFYAAAWEGRFLIGRCRGTGRFFWYPRAVSPFDFGPTTLEPASGKGVIYSFSTTQRDGPAHTIAYVTLAEGPTMMTALVECDPGALAIGQAVSLVWIPAADGTPVPCFRPG
ncbi:MAG: Zn-ribbon domain-containing OB-fold protein [Janthinobacterium lividum]